eukprot:4078674-Amphidinium_carterae.1
MLDTDAASITAPNMWTLMFRSMLTSMSRMLTNIRYESRSSVDKCMVLVHDGEVVKVDDEDMVGVLSDELVLLVVRTEERFGIAATTKTIARCVSTRSARPAA